jgi:hypothetical protein
LIGREISSLFRSAFYVLVPHAQQHFPPWFLIVLTSIPAPFLPDGRQKSVARQGEFAQLDKSFQQRIGLWHGAAKHARQSAPIIYLDDPDLDPYWR